MLGITNTKSQHTIHKEMIKWSDLIAQWKQCCPMKTSMTGIPKVLFAYRTAVHEASPFHLTFACFPQLPADVILGRL